MNLIHRLISINKLLPDDMFLTYQGLEIIEINTDMELSIELTSGEIILHSNFDKTLVGIGCDKKNSPRMENVLRSEF